jgi:hypothetical protein
MAKKQIADLTTSEAPEAAPVERPRALPQAFPGLTLSAVNREVSCIGGGPYDGTWTVPAPLPLDLSAGRSIYNLSDRAAGVYVYRVP